MIFASQPRDPQPEIPSILELLETSLARLESQLCDCEARFACVLRPAPPRRSETAVSPIASAVLAVQLEACLSRVMEASNRLQGLYTRCAL
jgi:hypothetical protein